MKKQEVTKLDKQWRDAIRSRDKCYQVCGGTSFLNAHHVIGRRNRNVRWDLDNGVLLCSGCHTFRVQSAHQDPLWFSEWFQDRYPNRYESIMSKRLISQKLFYDDVSKKLDF